MHAESILSFGLRPSFATNPDAPDESPARLTHRAVRAARCAGLWIVLACLACPPMPLMAQPDAGSAPTPIYAIQGDGAESPLQGTRVTTWGVVSGATVDGFFLQDPSGDGDPKTSDGLFVYTWEQPSVHPGQCVQVVDGLVTEYYGKTELTHVAAVLPTTGCSGALTPVDLPIPRLGISPTLALEPWEGMLVRLPQAAGVVHGPTRHFDAGEKEIALLPAHLANALRPGHLMHDQWLQDQPAALSLLLYLNNRLGADLPEVAFGQTASHPSDLIAVMDYAFGKMQLLPLPGTQWTVGGPVASPQPAASATPGEYAVCSYNLSGLGRGQDQFPHADAYAAVLAQRAQTIASHLQGCTVIALQETGTPEDAAALAAELAAAHGLAYTATAIPGPASADKEFPLTNSLLTRRDQVRVVEAFVSRGCSPIDYGVDDPGACAAGQFPLFDRPPLLAHLEIQGVWPGGVTSLWVVNNHWKSKAGDESVNAARRMAQARHVAAQVQAIVDADPAAQVVVTGDLNDFVDSPPVNALSAGVEPPLLHPFAYLPTLERYTYIYNGAAQVLDHLLLSENLGPQVAGVQVVHLHADFPAGGAVPTSDHDPVVLRLRPGGAASTGGGLGFEGIAVEAVSPDGRQLAAAITDAMGEYRLWGLSPGVLALHFVAPPGVLLSPSSLTWEAAPGYHPAPGPQVHHLTAVAAAALAVLTPDLAMQASVTAQPATP